MSSFYELSAADQATCLTDLARAALAKWDGQFGEPQLFKHRENAVFSVQRQDGMRVALRVHRAAYHSDAELRSELFWMRALGRSGIHVPPVISAADGGLFVHAGAPGVPEMRQVDMLGWLTGSAFGATDAERSGDSRATAAYYFLLGQYAARLHRQASEFELPDDFVRHSWDEAGLLGEAPVWGRFWAHAALSAAQRDLLLRAREKALIDLAGYGKSTQRFGLIHADLIRDNVLQEEGHLQVIDFDDCGFGWYLFDLATILYSIVDEENYGLCFTQLIAGYRSLRALPDAELDRLPLFVFLRATTYLGWLQTRSETENARKMVSTFIERCCRVASDYLQSRSLTHGVLA